MAASSQGSQRVRFFQVAMGICLIAAAAAGIIALVRWSPDAEESLAEARTAFQAGRYARALEYAEYVLETRPEDAEALWLMAESHAELKDFEKALGCCARIPDSAGSYAKKARLLAGEVHRRIFRRLEAAETEFRRGLLIDESDLILRDRLVHVLAIQTRTDELSPHVIFLLKHGIIRRDLVMMLASGHRIAPDAQVLAEFHQQNRNAPGVMLALSRQSRLADDPALALLQLKQVVHSRPDWAEAQGRLGRLLFEREKFAEWEDWHANLPPESSHPLIWECRGEWLLLQNEFEAAARCFGEALAGDPCLITANYQLGQVLLKLEQPDRARPFLERAQSLTEYDRMLDLARSPDLRIPGRIPYRKAAERAESLGLLWEAYGWAMLATKEESANWAEPMVSRIKPRLEELPLERTDYRFRVRRSDELFRYAVPPKIAGARPRMRQSPAGESTEIRFDDVAAVAGIDFSYFNSASPAFVGLGRVYEFTGGGVAVLDFDSDGWPDIYFTQGCRWPPGTPQNEHLDRLFRNQRDGTFSQVTTSAGLSEDRYSQGVTSGDFNSDGFSDLYIANIGGNRLFVNNGDGTWSDVSDDAGLAGEHWTTSCLMADLNGDGHPDLYDVNYLAGEDIFTRRCRDKSGPLASCTPQDFPADQDQCWLNLGDGSFRNGTAEAGIVVPNGKGLGIVACRPAGANGLNLFIANDGVPNFYFVNQGGSRLEFREEGLLTGLALNRNGQSEAGMGIAAGDFDEDGLLDFFVTNFFNESNTLYHQSPDHLFFDATREANLRSSSLAVLGFGTQAIDGDLDGRLDLAVANGHIDDYTHQGIPYRMRAQIYRNIGSLQFEEQPPEKGGPYFRRRLLGRSMAACDFNRDGLMDLAVSHLGDEAALLKNTTRKDHHYFAIRLRATRSDRQAIGARVTLAMDQRTLTREMTAGDGYQASNEKLLTFGLGSATRVDSVKIEWPSGRVETLEDPEIDRQYLAVESTWMGPLP